MRTPDVRRITIRADVMPSSRMPILKAYFLPPGIQPKEETRSFGSVRVHLPRLTATTLSEVMTRLRRAQGNSLASRSTKELAEILGRVADRWRNPEDPIRKTAQATLPEITGLAPDMVSYLLTDCFSGVTPEALLADVAADLGHVRALDEFRPSANGRARAFGPAVIVHILAGNIFTLPVRAVAGSLLVKSAVFAKSSSSEPVMATLFARSVAEVAPDLAEAMAVAWWPGESKAGEALERLVCDRADLVTATGSDEAVKAIRGRVQSPVLVFPHRASLGIVSREALVEIKEVAKAAALDVVLYDQAGCLSPHLFYVETGGVQTPRDFARALAEELRQLETKWPRGPRSVRTSAALHRFRSLAEIRQADGEDVIVLGSETGSRWTVLYEGNDRFNLSPLDRTIRVKPVADLLDVCPRLGEVSHCLQAAGVAVPQNRLIPLAEALAQVGIYRICPIGRMQRPPFGWNQDGMRFVKNTVKWVEIDSFDD